jgi:hypothetical protein
MHFACRELLGVGYVEILILYHSMYVLCLFLESKCQHGRAYIGQCLIRVYTQAALTKFSNRKSAKKYVGTYL